MIRAGSAFAIGALFLSASVVDAQPRRGREPLGANPSAVVKAEMAFARLAQDKGQWTAFRETADKDAVMFVPEAVNAQAWLRKQSDPPKAIAWKPYRVFVSCDGSYAASTGPWTQPNGATGTFTTIWRRQKNGSFKWVLDFGSDTKVPDQDDPIIEGKVADCSGVGGPRGPDSLGERRERSNPEMVRIAIPPPVSGQGQSDDGSLRWNWTGDRGERTFEVVMRYEGDLKTVLRETAAAPAP